MSTTPEADGFTPVTSDDAKLSQLIAYLEEHVPAYGFLSEPVPWNGTDQEVQEARSEANARAARIPDAIVHASMLVLGAGVNHTLPFVAFGMGNVSTEESTVAGVPCTVMYPKNPTGAVIVGAHGGSWWMGDGVCRANSFSPDAAALAACSGAIVIDVDYRLAPEHPMPAAAQDIAAVVQAVSDGSVNLPLTAGTVVEPIVLWGISSGAHACVTACDLLPDGIDIALLLNAPALDLRDASAEMRNAIFGNSEPESRLVSPAIHEPSRALRVHVQENVRDGVVKPAEPFLDKVRQAGGVASTASFLATHIVATPAVQRDRIIDAARYIVDVTDTQWAIPEEAAGEYDKEAIDRRNEASWRR